MSLLKRYSHTVQCIMLQNPVVMVCMLYAMLVYVHQELWSHLVEHVCIMLDSCLLYIYIGGGGVLGGLLVKALDCGVRGHGFKSHAPTAS